MPKRRVTKLTGHKNVRKLSTSLRKCVVRHQVLAYANYTKPFKVHTDASEHGLGAVLYKDQDDSTTRVIAIHQSQPVQC